MSIAHMLNSAWLVNVDGHEPRLELTFRDGQAFEAGLLVGTYEHVGNSFIATIGEDARLVVEIAAGETGHLGARLFSRHQGAVLDERATVNRVSAVGLMHRRSRSGR